MQAFALSIFNSDVNEPVSMIRPASVLTSNKCDSSRERHWLLRAGLSDSKHRIRTEQVAGCKEDEH